MIEGDEKGRGMGEKKIMISVLLCVALHCSQGGVDIVVDEIMNK